MKTGPNPCKTCSHLRWAHPNNGSCSECECPAFEGTLGTPAQYLSRADLQFRLDSALEALRGLVNETWATDDIRLMARVTMGVGLKVDDYMAHIDRIDEALNVARAILSGPEEKETK